jgi:hypothetical protein
MQMGALGAKASLRAAQSRRERRQTADFSRLAEYPSPLMTRRFNAVSLQQATDDSPLLASLAARVRDTNERLRAILELVPPEMRGAIQAGPVEDGVWCLLVQGSAAAAKLRQLLPALQARLRSKGWDGATVRIKVRQARR